MLNKQFIQDYFNADFKGIQSLLSEILIPIFQDYEDGYTEITVQTDKAKDMAKAAHIKTIKHVATLGGLAFDIKVFDVTLDDRCRIHQARKNIQALVRQFVDRFEGAFIVFHYANPKNRSWRLSYLEKRESNAASTNAKRYTYLCGQQYPCRTLAERFYKLQTEELTAVNLEEAFSVEALSKEFFDEYRYFYQDLVNFVCNEDNLIDGFVEYADGDNELAEKYVRDYIKKLMGRLVFIQFLQNKAWLNNDIHYTHTLFDRCSEKQKENFLDNVLEPLFFGVFNTPKEGREAFFRSHRWDMKLYEQWKDFPYLNGGLFECDELDKLSLPIPDYFFSNPEKREHVRTPDDKYYSDACGIFDFFDRYNFTIDESDPLDREIGVDPEMLGKIFENLLEDNKDKGAFYTPKEIVNYMCKEALVAYLVDEARRKSEVNKQRQDNFEEAIRAFVTDPEMTVIRMRRYGDQQLKDLNESLCNVKICDPAIGSGAFPMGLLNLLLSCRLAINEALGIGRPRAWLKKQIIQNNIYGVDIEKGAIDIARLRFWLSIVVDLDEPEPLPNFDYKFMQGNSLLEQFKGVDLGNILPHSDTTGGVLIFSEESEKQAVLKEHLDKYFTLDGHNEKSLLREKINKIVKDLVSIRTAGRNDITEALMPIDISANDQFFLWHTWFADVFNRPSKQGFDIVIGNPPYIQLQNNGGELAQLYENCSYATFARTGDIYCLFYERGWQLLKRNGHLCYITSNKWMRAGYGEKTRDFFANKTNPMLLIDFAGVKIFESATVDTNILLFSKSNNQHETVCAITNKQNKDSVKNLSDFVQQQNMVCDFSTSDSWVVLSPIEQSIKKKIEAVGTPLKDWDINIYRGVLTGCNEAFIIDTEKRNEILANCQSDEERAKTAELIRPILRGRDIKRYGYVDNGLYLINTHNGIRGKLPRIDINNYPAVKAHLDQYWDRIATRADKGDTPYNLRNCAYLEDFNKPKIIFQEIVQSSQFMYDETIHFMCNDTGRIIIGSHLPFILGILNSKLFFYAVKKFYGGGVLGEHGIRMKHTFFGNFPCLPYSKQIEDAAKELSIGKGTTDQIDALIFSAYALSMEEISIIEEDTM